ncbi:hypothetical protein MRBLPD1_003836 [Pseudomonas brassicacearum]|uniref:hypothetical protein n=1 Tax=Pseudomonas brassicacearum TaxID=930166 RepID=UPI003467D73F
MLYKASRLYARLGASIMCMVVAGCSTQQNTNPLRNVVGAQATLDLAEQAILAYERGDKAIWQSLLCVKSDDRPLIGWNSMRDLVGDISNVKLVKVSEASSASNGFAADRIVGVDYEVHSQRYPSGTLLLKFYPLKNSQCVGLTY